MVPARWRRPSETRWARSAVVVGIMRDKADDEVLRALAPVATTFICTAPALARVLRSELAAAAYASPGDSMRDCADSARTLDRAIRTRHADHRGSSALPLVGEVLAVIA